MTVQAVALGEVTEVLSGFAFKSEQFGDAGDLPIVRIRDVVRGQSRTFYTGDYSDKYVVNDGDLLIGMDGEFNRARWRGGVALLNQRVCRISSSNSGLDESYLYHFLPAALKEIERATPFATVKHLSAKQIKQIPIPLPPIEEQRRIAALLDVADSLRAKRLHALAKLDTLTQAIFIDMFDVAGWDAWVTEPVESLAARRRGSIRTGPFGSQLLHEEFTDQGIAVLGIDNAVQNRFAWGERRYITPEKYTQLKRYTVYPGDVLITIMGTCGRVAIVPDDIPTAINTKHLCCITLDPDRCLPEWLWASLRFHPLVLHQLGATHGAVMPGLNMGKIKQAEIPVPPIEVQVRFVEGKRAAERQLKSVRASASQLDALFASLQQRAFRGEL